MDAYELIHQELTRVGVKLAATLPDDWVGPLIGRIAADPAICHVPVARESEAVMIATGAFFAGAKSVAVIGNTGPSDLHRRTRDVESTPSDSGVLHRQHAGHFRRPSHLAGGARTKNHSITAGL